MKFVLAVTILGTAMMTTTFAQVIPEANHSDVLSLDAQVVTEVPTDTVTLTLGAEQEGAGPGAIPAALSRKADDVINQTKRISGVQTEAGDLNIYPNTDRNGKVSVWHDRTEVRITSKGFAMASKLAGQLANQVQMQSMNFTLSHETRTTAEAKSIDWTVDSFRDRALTTTKLLGYTSYTIRDVHVSEGSNNPGPRPMMRMVTTPVSFDSAPVPVEGDKAQVAMTVSGAVQMLK